MLPRSFKSTLLVILGASAACAGARDVVPTAPPNSPLPPQVLTDQPAEGGELIWLKHGLANGVVARRNFVEQGQLLREIQYKYARGATPAARAAKSPTALAEHSTTVNEYQNGQLVRTLSYDTVRELYAYTTTRYGTDGQKLAETYFSPEGVRHMERRFTPGEKARDQLQFDFQTGKRLLCFDGKVPADLDLAEGWGEPSGGLKYGIAASASSPDSVVCTIKNISDAVIEVPRDTLTRQMRPELTDAEGRLLPYDEKAVEQSGKATIGGIGKLPAGQAKTEFYRLPDWYGKLRPGTYKLRLLRLGADEKHSLISNTLQIVIPIPTAVITARKDRMRVEIPWHTVDVFADRVVEKSALQTGGEARVSIQTGLTVEGVEILMTPGKATFKIGAKVWEAQLQAGQVEMGKVKGQRIEVRLQDGKVEVLEQTATAGT